MNKKTLTVITNRAFNEHIAFYSETKSVDDFKHDTTVFIEKATHQMAQPVLTAIEKRLSHLVANIKPLHKALKTTYETRVQLDADPNANQQEKTNLTKLANKYASQLTQLIYDDTHHHTLYASSYVDALISDAIQIYYEAITDTRNLSNYPALDKIDIFLKAATDFENASQDNKLKTLMLTALQTNQIKAKNLNTKHRLYGQNDTLTVFRKSHLLKLTLNPTAPYSYCDHMTLNGWRIVENLINVSI